MPEVASSSLTEDDLQLVISRCKSVLHSGNMVPECLDSIESALGLLALPASKNWEWLMHLQAHLMSKKVPFLNGHFSKCYVLIGGNECVL